MKTLVQKHISTPLHTASLFYNSQAMEATQVSMDMDKEDVVCTHTHTHTHTHTQHTHTLEHYSAITKNEVLLFPTT